MINETYLPNTYPEILLKPSEDGEITLSMNSWRRADKN